MARRRHALDRFVFQLCGSRSAVRGVPFARARNASLHHSAWAARLLFRLDVWPPRAVFGQPGRPHSTKKSRSRWIVRLEPHRRLHFSFSRIRTAARLHDGRGCRRKPLLSGLHVDDQRLSRIRNKVESHGLAPDQRLRRHGSRSFLRRSHRRTFWMAMVLSRIRRLRAAARLDSCRVGCANLAVSKPRPALDCRVYRP